jgi:TRAP-type C4-dicarboxylate transport system substrate-binding protein
MKKSVLFLFFAIFFFLFSVNLIFAQRGTVRGEVVQIRFASPLPRNSDWGRALDRLAADWQRVTDNGVRVAINHDGREGGEASMLSSLSSDAIQVALFSTAGLSEICPSVMALSVPFLIKNDAELDRVLNDVKPVLNNRIRNDLVVIAWAKGGWVYLFSKEPVLTPDDLRRQRLGTSPELKEINQAFRTMGFTLVEGDMNSLGPMLASNRINSIYMIPAAIAPLQLHRNLSNMLELPIAPVMGAIVMNRVTWNKISAAHQQEILRVTQRIVEEFDAATPRAEANAIRAMNNDGLTLGKPTQAQENMWRAELDNALPSLIGTVIDRDMYQRINSILERSRSGQ